MSLVKNTATVGGMTLVSRFFGYVRDILIAGLLGASAVNDAFIIAFRLPNLFRAIFAEGAFSVSFVPKFNSVKSSSESESKKFAASIQSLLLIGLLILTLGFVVFMPQVISILAPGYLDNPEEFELIVQLSRITFPYILFISWAAFYGGILNSFDKFLPFALAPVMLNLVLIGACLIAFNSDYPGHVLSYAALVAGVLEFLFVLFFAHKIGFSLKLCKPVINDDVREMFRRLGPGIMSSGVLQINIWVSTILASFYIGGNSYIYYADRIYQLPIAIIGAALGTVVLPMLSKCYAKKDISSAKKLIENACFLGLFFAIPASLGISYLAHDIVEALFQRGEFGVDDTIYTASVLFIFSFGVPGYILYKLFSSCLFASGNTKFPFKTSVIAMLINIGISLSLFAYIGILSIPTGMIVSLYINVFLLGRKLKSDNVFVASANLKIVILKIVISSMIMLVGLMSFEYWLDQISTMLELIIEIIFGATFYTGSIIALRVVAIKDLVNIIKFKRTVGS